MSSITPSLNLALVLLIASFIALFLVFCGGCVGLPAKPIVTLCVIDYPAGEAICGDTHSVRSSDELTYAAMREMIEGSPRVTRVPLSTIDKSICENPSNWEKSRQYVIELETYAKTHCQ